MNAAQFRLATVRHVVLPHVGIAQARGKPSFAMISPHSATAERRD
jgi:hypothetical protein